MQANDYATIAVALIVPVLAYQFALRQENRRWLREQRAALYLDLLVEIDAEQDWATFHNRSEQDQQEARYQDHRMSPKDRKHLDARVVAYASPQVLALYTRFTAEWLSIVVSPALEGHHRQYAAEVSTREGLARIRERVRFELLRSERPWWRPRRRLQQRELDDLVEQS